MDMKMASGYYLNVFEDALFKNEGRDVFVIFNEANDTPTIDEMEQIRKLIEGELEKNPLGDTLQEVVETCGLTCVDFGVQVFSPDNGRILPQRASNLIENYPSFAREIFQKMDMEYMREDVEMRLKDNFSKEQIKSLSDEDIEIISESFKNALEHNDTYWDTYWLAADYVIEEHLKEKVRNLSLGDRVKDAEGKISERDGELRADVLTR